MKKNKKNSYKICPDSLQKGIYPGISMKCKSRYTNSGGILKRGIVISALTPQEQQILKIWPKNAPFPHDLFENGSVYVPYILGAINASNEAGQNEGFQKGINLTEKQEFWGIIEKAYKTLRGVDSNGFIAYLKARLKDSNL